MSGYFGSERQRALQARSLDLKQWAAATPGIYNAGRFLGCDDPDRVPWPMLAGMLERDGLLGLRMISREQAGRLFPRLESAGCRIDSWDILVGDPETARAAASEITGAGLPAGMGVAPPLRDGGDPATRRIQQFLADNGLAPFPGSLLTKQPPHAKTVVLEDVAGRIAATGHAYFPHNAESPFHRHAWIGLIAVAPQCRGQGVGRLINAMLVLAAFRDLGASAVYAMVAPANTASRRMVEACGLRAVPQLVCGVAMAGGAARFTR